MNYLGIDPGLSGAAVLLRPDGGLEIDDLPTIKAGKRSELDLHGLMSLLKFRNIGGAVLEQVGVRPGEGAVGAFSFGTTYGALRMALVAAGIPTTLVRPNEWKKTMRVPAAKDAAVARASDIFPRYASMFRGPRGGLLDGRAEAALLALWLKEREQRQVLGEVLS